MGDSDVFFGLPQLLIPRSSESGAPIEISTENSSIIGLHTPEFSRIWLNLGRGKEIQKGKNHENHKNYYKSKTRADGRKRLTDSDSATSIYPETVMTVLVPFSLLGSVIYQQRCLSDAKVQ